MESAEAARQQRQQDVDETRRAHSAADLRPHLAAGEPCPVCEQTVSTLPAPLHAPAIEDAQARLDEAATEITALRNTVRTAASAEAKAAAKLDTLTDQRARWITSLSAALAGPLAAASLTVTATFLNEESKSAVLMTVPEAVAAIDESQAHRARAAIDEVRATLNARQSLNKATDAAAVAVETARAHLRSAQAVVEKTETEITAARDVLHTVRDPLVGLGAPSADGTTLAAGWMRLATWAVQQAQMRASELTEARQAAQTTASQKDRAQAGFAEAETKSFQAAR